MAHTARQSNFIEVNDHKKLLSCWHKLEHFSPASAPKAADKQVELLKEKPGWKTPLKSTDPNKTIDYIIYLGVFDSSVVNDFVNTYFNNTDKDENFRNSKICFASLKLDEEGRYINESFGLSTLPWALGQLVQGNIKSDDWENAFGVVKARLIEYIELNFKEVITNAANEVVTVSTLVNNDQLLALQGRIELLCQWRVIPEKDIYVKRVERFKSKRTKDTKSVADILNSFYIKDLETILSKFDKQSTQTAFQQYLDGCLGKQAKRTDIVKDIDRLKSILTPANYPDGCWPSEYTLSLMQQVAVNTIFNNLSGSDEEGMYSVNGPPGTGKTTLLRDIIAPIFVKRAKELIKIDHPADGFKKVGSLKVSETYSPFIYEPVKSITHGGIVIASSNNGAVENISKELPLKKEVSKRYSTDIAYFKSVAEQCIDSQNWGLISAVLGNKQNRNDLVSSLWFNEDVKDLQKTLKEDKLLTTSDWNTIKSTFNSKLQEVSLEKQRLTTNKEDYTLYIKTLESLHKTNEEVVKTASQLSRLKSDLDARRITVSGLIDAKKNSLNELVIVKGSKPNFFSYWFNRNERNIYKKSLINALNRYNQISENLDSESIVLSKLEPDLKSAEILKAKLTGEQADLSGKVSRLTELTQKAKAELKDNYADVEFWDMLESGKSQASCPWYSDKLKTLQSELFVIALQVNEVFILTANGKSSRISTTIAAFFEYLKGGMTVTNQEVKAMWDTFFLVIPVISSTFASIQTMVADLGKEDLPWLFIDEAGQAIPQAAAGSIWRSQRVGVVGDPFQIEPVVTIPKSISDNISNYFDLDSTQVSSELSVQSMADRINPLGTYLTINSKQEWIGIPLRVHRRCISPMFDIANDIAYDNTMYNSTSTPKSVSVSFQTSFIHCTGLATGRHFVQEQADIIKDLLVVEINVNKGLPDVFVITPFSEISNALTSFLHKHLPNEVKKYKDTSKEEMGEWLKSHIGTVHTFQGKQAEGVILCLGLDEKSKGAANWASKKPNLLNVAITRAKYRFIAIGDKDIWYKQAYFNQLKKLNK